jgi:hypothetical protein
MATTPEGKVKAAVRKVLARYEPLYQYWPVPAGYGPSSLDCLVCFHGRLIAIETKAPGKKPTPRQISTIREIAESDGKVFVIDNVDGTKELEEYLEYLHANSTSERQT